MRYPQTIGVDLDASKVEAMRAAGLAATTDAGEAAGADVYLVAVSTGPRMESLIDAVSALRPARGGLISVESTVVPGTMAKVAEVFSRRGIAVGSDLYLVHAPHRILFGVDESIFGQPRLIAGVTPACLEQGVAFYRQLVPAIHSCDDVRLVELAKLVENTVRHLEISFAEAMALYCHEAGLDFEQLVEMVASKGNVRLLRAEYGIGGECLPKDARFLHEITGCRMIADAVAIDEEYRSWLFREAKAPRVLVRGITFKRGWRDLGYSKAVELVERLEAAGCEVWVEDPLYTPEELASLGFRAWRGEGEVDSIVSWGKVTKGE